MGRVKADGEPLPPTPYTPGPWSARDYKTKEGGIWIDCDAWARRKNGVLVRSAMDSARTVGGTVATVMETGTGEEWTVEANAALIAAAPELAEALLAILAHEEQGAQRLTEMGVDVPVLPWEAQARNALKKANLL